MNNVELGKWYIDQLIYDDECSCELEHSGRKGMKWGVRRGPPYPIGSGKKNISDVGAKPLKYKSKAMQYLKQFGKTSLKYVAAMLIPGAGILMNAKSINDYAKNNLDNKKYDDGDYEKVSELKKKTSKSSAIKDAKEVNVKDRAAGRINNCMLCTAAFEMRRRGYDVEARRSGHGNSTDTYKTWFDGVEMKNSFTPRANNESRKSWVERSYNSLVKSLEENPNGSRGFCAFNFEKMNSGHTISWEIENGEVVFYDSQHHSNPLSVDKVFSFSDQNYLWGRLDNCKVTDEVSMAVVSRKDKKK